MSKPKHVVIRAQALDGTWQVIGASDYAVGITPENDRYVTDQWGPANAQFALRRQPGYAWPDLHPWTPVEVEIGGVLVWDGRVNGTPSSTDGRVLNVNCVGWQTHLDDDTYVPFYVHAKLADWNDAREFLGENLAVYTTAGSVQSQSGTIALGWPNGAVLPAGAGVAVTLDLGPVARAKRVSVDFKGITGAANSGASVYVRGGDTENSHAGGTFEDAYTFTLAVLGTNLSTNTGSFVTTRRYVTIMLFAPAAVTLNGDVMVQIRGVRVFAATAYESANQSVLKASTVVSDALDQATQLLDADRSGITATSTSISDLAFPFETRNPRQMIEAVNAYHDWTTRMGLRRRFQFAAKATRPRWRVGRWSGMDFDDSSAGSGDEIFNRARVTGRTPADQPVLALRSQTGTMVDRRGFNRTGNLPVQSKLPSDLTLANLLADTWLAAHRTTPFEGTATVVGSHSLRDYLTGDPVPVERLLLGGDELLHFDDHIDPDTGWIGRDGRIANVTYDRQRDEATVVLDNHTRSYEALLARVEAAAA